MLDDTNPTPDEETVPYSNQNEEEWLKALKAMDNAAWDALLRHHAGELRQSIAKLLRKYNLSEHWADDIEQEVWRTAIKKIGEFEYTAEGKFYGWLYQIAHNHIRNQRRKLKDDNASFDAISDESEETGLTLDFFLYANGLFEDSAEEMANLREELAALDGALMKLKPRDCEIVVRRLILQETPREIAEHFDMKPSTISMILFRAKEYIRVQMMAGNIRRQQ
jgi:RNA polymerase sigma factor (sigma-70 family)